MDSCWINAADGLTTYRIRNYSNYKNMKIGAYVTNAWKYKMNINIAHRRRHETTSSSTVIINLANLLRHPFFLFSKIFLCSCRWRSWAGSFQPFTIITFYIRNNLAHPLKYLECEYLLRTSRKWYAVQKFGRMEHSACHTYT